MILGGLLGSWLTFLQMEISWISMENGRITNNWKI